MVPNLNFFISGVLLMKKTFTKSLSVLLALLMIITSFSVAMVASAEGEKQEITATYLLDFVDEKLAEADLNGKISLPSAATNALKLAGVTIKLNSVNEICATLNSLAKSSLVGTVLKLGGDLKNLNLSVWKTKYTRGSDAKDFAIISAVVNFLKANTGIVHKFLQGKLDLGTFGDIKVDGKTLNATINGVLGEGGACGKLKDVLAGLVYEEGSAERTAAAKKSLDKLIFEDLATVGIDKLLKMADDAILNNYVNTDDPNEVWSYLYKTLKFKFEGSLAGFEYDNSKTVDGFIADVANAIYAKLRSPLNSLIKKYGKTLNELLANTNEYTKPFAKLVDFTKLNAVEFTATSVKDINVFLGTIVKQISDFAWDDSANLGKNIQDLFIWGIANRDKTVPNDPYKSVTGKDFAAYALALAKMIVKNVVSDDAALVSKMNACKSATEVITVFLPYVLNRGGDKVVAAGSTTWEKVLGDIVGYYLGGYVPLAGYKQGTSIWDVLNTIANYYLVDWNIDALFGIQMTKTSKFLEKVDQLQAVLFKGTDYEKASTYLPALIKNILALDLDAVVGKQVEAVFVDMNTKTPAAEYICIVVNNLYNSLLKTDLVKFTRKAATCAAAGNVKMECKLCGKNIATSTYPKTSDHKWDKGKVTKKATYTATGIKTYTCTVCKKATMTEEIDKLPIPTVAKVSGLKTTKQTTKSIVLKWSAAKNADKYEVYRSTDGKTFKKIATVTKATYTDKAVKAGLKYQYKVKGIHSASKAEGKDSSVLKTGTITDAPKISSLKSTKSKTAVVTWKKVTGAKNYTVYKSTDGKKWSKVSTTTKTTLTLTKLAGGKKIYVKVLATNNFKKDSAFSAVKNVKVKK